MPWYLTIYRIGNHQYGDYLWARGWKDADRVARRRGIGERIRGQMNATKTRHYPRASTLLRKRKVPPEMLHALSHVGFLAIGSNAATLNAILGDEGLIHLFGHWQQFSRPKAVRVEDADDQRLIAICKPRRLAKIAAEIERRIPGYCGPS